MKIRFGIVGLALLAMGSGAHAQTAPQTRITVANCGTPPATYNANQPNPATMDTSGQDCVDLSGGSGSTVKIDQTTPGTTNGVSLNASTPVTATLQNAATATGNGSTLNTSGMSSAVLTVNCSACSGGTTVNFEGTEDGTNYSSIVATQLGTSTLGTSTQTAGVTLWQVPVSGLQNVRSRISAYSAGTITVTGHAAPVDWNSRTVYAGIQATNGDSLTDTGNALDVNIKTSSLTNQAINVAQVNGHTALEGGSNGGTGVGGLGAAAATVAGNPVRVGCRGATAAPTAVTDGQLVDPLCGDTGKQITLPYSLKENAVRGYATATNNAATSIIASAGGSLKNYITAVQCYNTSATTITVAFSDSVSTAIIVPAGSGNNPTFPTPLATAAATAFTFTASTGQTTIGCSAQGYTGL